ncbi:MAG TPA: hypothetical protein VII72_01380 [Myxococcota bacterium]
MSFETRSYLHAAGYGLLVFFGTALLGFVIAPWLGVATGLFTIEAESSGFFSMLTLKGVPYLVALSVLSGPVYPMLAGLRLPARLVLMALNVLVAWSIGAAIAFAILG